MDKATFSFGYGLMVNPLQLARVYATIGNGGIIKPLSIIKVKNSTYGTRIFSKKIVKTVLNMMEHSLIKANNTIYKIAIKTGTVKISSNGFYINQYVSYAAAIAPLHYPIFSIIVVINNPKSDKYYGRDVSIPILKKISTQILYFYQNKK